MKKEIKRRIIIGCICAIWPFLSMGGLMFGTIGIFGGLIFGFLLGYFFAYSTEQV